MLSVFIVTNDFVIEMELFQGIILFILTNFSAIKARPQVDDLSCTNGKRYRNQNLSYTYTRKYPLRGYILGVLTHTTA